MRKYRILSPQVSWWLAQLVQPRALENMPILLHPPRPWCESYRGIVRDLGLSKLARTHRAPVST